MRTVLVTGGGSGIGAAIVSAFSAQGDRVAYLDLIEGGAGYVHCDLTSPEQVARTIRAVAAELGPIGVLVNNAGWDERHGLDAPVELWDRIQDVNLRPHFLTAQAVAPQMRQLGGGAIVNLSSTAWTLGNAGYPAYVAAKAGIVGLTRGLARELGPDNIRVNTVLPGWVRTQRQLEKWVTPEAEAELMQSQCLPRWIEPSDIADAVVFLASQRARMITGQSLVVDGGRT